MDKVRIEYRLPADVHNQFQGWQRDERCRFPDDRSMQASRNQAEFAEKAAAGRLVRRPRQKH